MPKSPRQNTNAVLARLSDQGRQRLEKLQEATGATQASVIEEALTLMERVINGENVWELYAQPFQYLVASESDKSTKKIIDSIYRGLNEVLNQRLHDIHTGVLVNNYMIAELFRKHLVTDPAVTAERLISEFRVSADEIARELEKSRYRAKGDS